MPQRPWIYDTSLTHGCAMWQTVQQVVLALGGSVHVQITMTSVRATDTHKQAKLFLGVAAQSLLQFVSMQHAVMLQSFSQSGMGVGNGAPSSCVATLAKRPTTPPHEKS